MVLGKGGGFDVYSRNEKTVEEWVKSLKCPVIRIDGTKPIDENTNFII